MELAQATAHQPLDSVLVDPLMDVAAGNPLAVRELAAHPELLTDWSPVVPLPVTDVAIDAFTRRVRFLDDSASDVLTLVAAAPSVPQEGSALGRLR